MAVDFRERALEVPPPSSAPSGTTLRRSLDKFARRVRANVLRRRSGIVYQHDVESLAQSEPCDTASLRLRRLSDEEIAQTTTWNVPQELVRRRLEAGDLCFGIVAGGEVIYLHWWTSHTCLVRGADLLLTLSASDRYYYNVVVKSAFRGQGIYRIAQQQFLSLAAEQGIGRLIAYVEMDNHVARHITERMAYRRVATVHSFRALGLRIGTHYDALTGERSRILANGLSRKHYWI